MTISKPNLNSEPFKTTFYRISIRQSTLSVMIKELN
jgi:hypothetical protein